MNIKERMQHKSEWESVCPPNLVMCGKGDWGILWEPVRIRILVLVVVVGGGHQGLQEKLMGAWSKK